MSNPVMLKSKGGRGRVGWPMTDDPQDRSSKDQSNVFLDIWWLKVVGFGGLGLSYRKPLSHLLTLPYPGRSGSSLPIRSGVPCTVNRRTYEHIHVLHAEVHDATLQPQIEATILEYDNQDCEATPNAGTRLLASVVCCKPHGRLSCGYLTYHASTCNILHCPLRSRN
jgi:hypothetical protein